MATENLARKDIPNLLTDAFGASADGVHAAEAFLNAIPEGESHPRRLKAFGGNPLQESSVKKELAAIISAKTAEPAPSGM